MDQHRGEILHSSELLPRDIFGVVPVLPLGIVMRHLPTRVADALAWPMIRIAVGDVTKLGLKKLPYGPNTQMARDHHVPLLDIGTMDQIKRGRRLRERLTNRLRRGDPGHRIPSVGRRHPRRLGSRLRQLGDADGVRCTHRARRPLLLRDVRLARRDAL
jgi:hypothetical protein